LNELTQLVNSILKDLENAVESLDYIDISNSEKLKISNDLSALTGAGST
jgi:hypothetical protein